MEEELNVHPIYLIGTRAVLLLGCERRLLLFSATLLVATAYSLQNIAGLVLTGFMAIFLIGILRKMAKYDPYLSEVFISQRRFKKFYHAHATHFGINNKKYK